MATRKEQLEHEIEVWKERTGGSIRSTFMLKPIHERMIRRFMLQPPAEEGGARPHVLTKTALLNFMYLMDKYQIKSHAELDEILKQHAIAKGPVDDSE